MEQTYSIWLFRYSNSLKGYFHIKPLGWYLYTLGTCYILRKILTKDINTTAQTLRKTSTKEKAQTHLLSRKEEEKEGYTHVSDLTHRGC